MTQKVFKAVKEVDGNYYSVADTPFAIKYPVNEWVKPQLQNSKLFCFQRIDRAASFLRAEGLLEENKLFEAEVDSCEESCGIIAVFGSIQAFWNGQYSLKMSAPWGTYFTDKIKLIKEIPRDEWINQ